jgi:hypothetical protein
MTQNTQIHADRRESASSASSAADLYLDLMKRTLSYALWPEPGVPVETFNHRSALLKKPLVAATARVLRAAGLQLVRLPRYSDEDRRAGKIHPMQAHTMIGMARLDNLQSCVERALADGVPGDLIETGVWRGGASIFMRAVLAAHGVTDRRVFVADSFAGLPPPDAEKYPQDRGDKHYKQTFLAVSRREVEENFRAYGLLDDQVVFLEGWFKDTLPSAPIERLAVMRLDGDMYGSTIEALEALYPKLSPGGFCVIDDYALAGCRRAVDDFRAANRIESPVERIDWSGVYWRKGE